MRDFIGVFILCFPRMCPQKEVIVLTRGYALRNQTMVALKMEGKTVSLQ